MDSRPQLVEHCGKMIPSLDAARFRQIFRQNYKLLLNLMKRTVFLQLYV